MAPSGQRRHVDLTRQHAAQPDTSRIGHPGGVPAAALPPPDAAPAGRVTGPALLAVAHGTRDPVGVAALESLVARVRTLRPGLSVELAYVDDASPSVARALTALGAAGVRAAAVVPLLLTAGSHSKGDIPGSVARSRREQPGLRLAYGRPLGPHPLLLEALGDRLRAAGVDDSDRGATAVVLVAAGAADPDANAEVARMGRLLLEDGGFASVDVAFASATRPDVVAALERLDRERATRVAVSTYLLTPGFFAARVAGTAGPALHVAAPLGDHPAVARLVLERYDEALAGDIRMGCDVCLYRTPVAGRDGRGAPQRPHPHPDDA